MKLTVVTGPKNELVAVVHAHLSEHDRNRAKDGPHATLRPQPGQKFHEIQVGDELKTLAPAEFRKKVLEHALKAK